MTLALLSLLLLLPACGGGSGDTGAWIPPGCGDGVQDAGEECDDGQDNSDVEADACRESCLLPACGDAVTDSGEECDDGDGWGGDGCTPLCTAETGQLEAEPNDGWDQAEDWGGTVVHGSLQAGDSDCFSFELPACAAVGAHLQEPCPAPATLRLHDPDGVEVARGTPDATGCALLDPADAPGARFTAEGRWALCVAGLLDAAVPWYALELDLVAPEDASYELDPDQDPDGDGKPASCDDDRDGDGIDDDSDSCPDVPNGPEAGTFSPDSSGFLRAWLAAGPFDGRSSPDGCLPTEDDLVAVDDALAAPAIGDPVPGEDGLVWHVLLADSSRVGFEADYKTVAAPREIYVATYIYSETDRALTLALGPDDGARAWLGGEELLAISGCQGTTIDQYQAEVSLVAGWQPLLLKVYDQGGGWGSYVRFLEGGEPVTDLVLALDPTGAPLDQADSDGDGLGDACDPTP